MPAARSFLFYISETRRASDLSQSTRHWSMQEEQKGACSTISASQPLLLIFDQSDSVNLLLHRSHLSWERSCSRSHDTFDLWDPGSWGSITAWASLSFWSLASRRSRARWSGRWHRFESIGSVVTSLLQWSVGFLEDPGVDGGSLVSFFSSFSSSSFSFSSLIKLDFSGDNWWCLWGRS